VCVLLDADCPFPHEFDSSDIEKGENTSALLKQVEDRQSFHQAIKKGSENVVKEFIKSYPRLKRAYDLRNQSALMTALEESQYELYALLQSKGLCADENEEPSLVIEGLNSEGKHRLKEANLKYFEKQDDSHIIYLLSKSRMGIGQEKKENFGIIRKLYKKLDSIPEISTILKVLEQSELRDIIFDFDKDSIVDLDPTYSSEAKGSCEHKEGHIYIGAKNESELLGTLAHELAHLAMQVCYGNECNPYGALDEQKKCAFGKIVAECHKSTGKDDIIERVFSHYEDSIWPAELIVRVPHMLARYIDENGERLLTEQAQELFKFYKQNTEKDLAKFIGNPLHCKVKNQIQRLNKRLEKLDEFEQSKIRLNDECLLNDDVINCQTIQILSSNLPRLTELNLYQLMRRKELTLSDIKSGYIFASAEDFKNQEKAENIFQTFQSVTRPTLIIEYSSDYDKSETNLWTTIERCSQNRRIIFVAVTDVAQSLQNKLKKYQAQMKHDREYTWGDLTTDSQNELLKNAVCFQGSQISLNKLISAESRVTKFLPLADLLEKKTMEIGKPLVTSTTDGCIENYYVSRTFNHQVVIKKDILEKKISHLVATSEQEFKKYCLENPERNVHWLLTDKSGKLIWRKSRGSLRALHEYIDTRNPLPYPQENLYEFFQKSQYHKVILIADTAGMGKTTVLTHLSKQIKQKFPSYWVVRIDLNDHTDILEDQMKKNIGTIEFLSQKLLKFRYPFEKELFKECSQGLEKATKVVLMFDGFDEISPKYKKTVFHLLQDLNPLKQQWLEQLWVTTRPHLREELQDKLQQLCYTLEPFSKENQVEFLTKFWYQHSKIEEGNQEHLKAYARALIQKLAQSINDKEKEFTGIPLQTRMLAEAFGKEIKTYCLSQKSEPELPKQLCLVDLYREFIKEKINIFKSKGEVAKEQDNDIIQYDISITKNHQKLALEILLPELKDTALKLEESDKLAPEAISRIGIVQYVDDKPHFIHRTFAEFYVADFLEKQLTKKTCFLLEVLNILFKILLGKDYAVIRFFLDGLLVNTEKSKVIEQYGQQINEIWKVKESKRREELVAALRQAAEEGRTHIIDFLFSSLKATGNSDTTNKLLIHKESRGRNSWHLAANSGQIKTLETLWRWGTEVQVNLKDDLLLAKDRKGKTAWDIAAQIGNKEILEILWVWGRKLQVNLKDNLLLAKGRDGVTAWHRAAANDKKEILEKLWVWGIEVQLNLKYDLLLSKGRKGLTAWERAAMSGSKEILEKLWGWGRKVQVNLKDDLLLAKGRKGLTAWERAAMSGNKEILEKLWVWGRKVQVNLKDVLLLAKGKDGLTAWDRAAISGNKEILEALWGWGKKVQVNLKDDLLLAKGKKRTTAWDRAAVSGNKEILEALWIWGKEVQVKLKDDLLLAKGRKGLTAWERAAMSGNKEILEALWIWGKEVQVNLKDDLLLAKGRKGLTAWDRVAMRSNKEILEKLWCWGREVKGNLKDDLLLAKGVDGLTAWDIAAEKGNKEILETLWGWGKEVQVNLKDDLLLANGEDGLTPLDREEMSGNREILEALLCWGKEVQDNLKNNLLLAKGRKGLTAWERAAMNGNKEILEALWCWGKEVQVNVKDDLLLAKGRDGVTAWHRAAAKGKKEILEKVWVWGIEVQLNLKYDLLLSKGRKGLTAWDIAAMSGNKEILEALWSWGKEVQVNLKNDLLLSKGRKGLTAWERAAMSGNKAILEALWCWGKEVQVNLKDDLLLSKGRKGLTVLDRAKISGNKVILETLSGWVKEVQVNLKDDLLLAKSVDQLTAWGISKLSGNKEI
jgi:ankyrin repeat protein